jgi:hypothetical protein
MRFGACAKARVLSENAHLAKVARAGQTKNLVQPATAFYDIVLILRHDPLGNRALKTLIIRMRLVHAEGIVDTSTWASDVDLARPTQARKAPRTQKPDSTLDKLVCLPPQPALHVHLHAGNLVIGREVMCCCE